MTDTAAKPAAEKATPKTGDYVVLQQDKTDPANYIVVDSIAARSASEAIRKTIIDKHDEATYVAVPERSWRPVTVTVETKTTIRLS